MKLLLGDDQPIFGALIAQNFREHGHTVLQPVTAPCTALAMREWIGCDVCVIGLGITPLSELPVMLGTRGSRSSPAVVVLLSAAAGAAVDAARQMGVTAVGTKDDDFEAIHALVKEASRRRGSAGTHVILSPGARSALDDPSGDMVVSSITPRERQILQLLATGKDTTGMAGLLGVRVTTVRTHVASLMNKLGAHTRLEAVAIARRLGLLDAPQPIEAVAPGHHGALLDRGRG